MAWLDRLRNRNPSHTAEQTAELDAWLVLPPAQSGLLDRARFVIIDVETTGLNLAQDKLIAIGAVAVVNGSIDLNDSFEMVLQQNAASSRQNILIHGIGGNSQIEGIKPVEVLLAFLDYLQKSPLVAFHVTFDKTMLRRAIKLHLGIDFKHPWLDLAYLTPGLYPELGQRYRALDDWLNHFHIQNYARHNALADAVSTAQLFMIACNTARQKNIADYRSLQRIEQAQRWLEQ